MRPLPVRGNVVVADGLPQCTVTHVRPKPLWRLPLWSAFLGLTALIVVYPVNLRLESFPVLSPDIFPNLPLFGAIFYLWAASLLVLVFTPSDEGAARWERLALVAVAALVFRGFWNIIAPLQGQAITHALATKVWQTLGHVVPYQKAVFTHWPGYSLVPSIISQTTGVELFPSIAILNIFISIVIGIAAYIFLLGVLKSSLSASLACLLIIEGSLALIILFSGGPQGLTFMVVFLVVLFSKRALANPSPILVALLLLTAVAVTRFPYSMHFSFILLGLWGFAALRRSQAKPGPSITMVMLSFLIPVAWLFHWATTPFSAMVQWIWGAFLNPSNFAEWLINFFTISQSNFGESAPLWYSRTRLFWFVLLYVTGGLLWLRSLRKIQRLGPTESRLAAAFSGLVLLSFIALLISPRGSVELLQFFQSGVFFTTPFLLLFLHRFKPQVTKAALLGLAVVLVALSLPSFLATNLRINSLSSHRIDLATGEWLQSLYGTGRGIHVFGMSGDMKHVQFYLFEANVTDEPAFLASSVWTQEVLWQSMDEFMTNVDRYAKNGSPIVVIHSPRFAFQMSETLGIPLDHPRWAEMAEQLSERNNEIYSNGPIRLYGSLGTLSGLKRR